MHEEDMDSTWNHTLERLPCLHTRWDWGIYADKIAKLPYLATRSAVRCTTAECASAKPLTAFAHANARAVWADRAIGVARALLLRRGPSNTRDGRKRAP